MFVSEVQRSEPAVTEAKNSSAPNDRVFDGQNYRGMNEDDLYNDK